jgi:flavodoxin
MKALVVFYSRTGVTKKAAEAISSTLKCDIEEIIDTKDRKGVIGYLTSGRDAMKKKLAEIKDTKYNPSFYDLTIIGSPVWAHHMASPIRAYISKNKVNFKNIALFCTMGGSGAESVLGEMGNLCGKDAISRLGLKTKDILSGQSDQKIKTFVDEIRGKIR